MKYTSNGKKKGIITIEASLVFFLFMMGYIYINYMAITSHIESNIKKSINSMALELANYGMILDDTRAIEYISKDDSTSLLQQLSEKGKSLIGKKDLNFDDTILEVKNVLINSSAEKIKELAYNKLLKKMLVNKLPTSDYLEKAFIKGGLNGLDFRKSRLFDKGDIELRLEYEFELILIKGLSFRRRISQEAFISTNIKIGEKRSSSDEKENKEDSIWKQTNFKRGKYFAEYVREQGFGERLKIGQGVDIYNESTNCIFQIHSVNIFMKSYSELVAGNYKIKEAELEKLFRAFASKMADNINRLDGKLVLENGNEIPIKEFSKKELIIVVPNEAKSYEKVINEVISKIEGFSFKLIYKENAL